MHESIQNYISRFVSLTPEELSVVKNCMQLREFPKKTVLLNAGDVCNFEAYVLKGCIREYFIDHKGQELTLEFAVEDWWVSDITSFENQTPSIMYIETLEDCELLVLSRASKDELLARVPKLERMFRLMIQRHLSVLQKRLFRTVSYTAMDKFEEFLKRYPSLPQRVPQHYIASYLGITPEFLSKLRKRQMKGE
ncbi:cyclic nucleotide-binding protein [Emticicia aquatilis]|uniref:Cyclic nucleotide-binding protein n=1 Tax=Emticicia aquatilis TaxID=1537369 RepID=A0A916YV47_9BACT|nr:Crp/Fnr family transcriptional regulator [Emticicia aquatilis]GGD62448.1 cyclic nucleotide-binding protein [Emticicia aquatilis]